MKKLVVVRGAGEIASAVIHYLYRSGFRVLILEQERPTSTRRCVSFAEAMYDGEATVERITCYKAEDLHEAKKRLKDGDLVMLEDVNAQCLAELEPDYLVDAILCHENLGTNREMAKHTIALGPGFCAGRDVDLVIETMRGHDMGRFIHEGLSYRSKVDNGTIKSSPNYAHLCFAPASGIVKVLVTIGMMVHKGETVATVTSNDKVFEVCAKVDGIVRGVIRNDIHVKKGQKIGDIHPKLGQEDCFTLSDKARCIAGAVLEAIMIWENEKPKNNLLKSITGGK